MIHAYVGTPGSGKSYTVTMMGVKALAEGRHWWANYTVIPEFVYIALRKRYKKSHQEALAATLR
jgi:zona occludens toxin (predicted ATPase)